MDITIAPRLLKGRITPPPSKSQAHRALIAAALAGGGSRIENLADSQDIQATSRCLAALCAPGSGLPRSRSFRARARGSPPPAESPHSAISDSA